MLAYEIVDGVMIVLTLKKSICHTHAFFYFFHSRSYYLKKRFFFPHSVLHSKRNFSNLNCKKCVSIIFAYGPTLLNFPSSVYMDVKWMSVCTSKKRLTAYVIPLSTFSIPTFRGILWCIFNSQHIKDSWCNNDVIWTLGWRSFSLFVLALFSCYCLQNKTICSHFVIQSGCCVT